MFKRALALVLGLTMAFSLTACKKDDKSKEGTQTPENATVEYEEKQFEISGFWAPYDISEEGLQKYKDVGFTTLAMINHSLGRTSEEQFYLGSERTKKALELCKKVGLNAILNYHDWIAESCEEEGKDYFAIKTDIFDKLFSYFFIDNKTDIASFSHAFRSILYILLHSDEIPEMEKALRFILRGLVLQMVE